MSTLALHLSIVSKQRNNSFVTSIIYACHLNILVISLQGESLIDLKQNLSEQTAETKIKWFVFVSCFEPILWLNV